MHAEGWARVGAGVKWLRVVEDAAPYGLAPLSGSITDVGIVGYTTGGGLGPMARTYGLAIDRVRAIEVVTGDGELRRVTPTEHPDLFFGLRGGKGMLGIVTAIEFDLVHQPTFYGGSVWFDGEDAATVIERWLHWSEQLPELATTSIALFQMPPLPDVPPALAGRLTLSVRYVWTGDAGEGERRFAEIREAAPVILDDVALKPYTAIDSVHTDPLDPIPAYEAAAVLADFPTEAVDSLLDLTGPGADSPQVIVEVRQMGGAIAREGEHAERLQRARHGVRAARPSASPAPRTRGPRGGRPRGPRTVDRWSPDAELHVRAAGLSRRVRRADDRETAPGDPEVRPARRDRHRPRAVQQLRTRVPRRCREQARGTDGRRRLPGRSARAPSAQEPRSFLARRPMTRSTTRVTGASKCWSKLPFRSSVTSPCSSLSSCSCRCRFWARRSTRCSSLRAR